MPDFRFSSCGSEGLGFPGCEVTLASAARSISPERGARFNEAQGRGVFLAGLVGQFVRLAEHQLSGRIVNMLMPAGHRGKRSVRAAAWKRTDTHQVLPPYRGCRSSARPARLYVCIERDAAQPRPNRRGFSFLQSLRRTEPMEKTKAGNQPPKSAGRPKGVLNKTTALLKDAILKAAEGAGGKDGLVGYLQTQAKANPGPFMALLGKVLPMQVVGEGDGPLKVEIIKRVYGDDPASR